MDSTVNKNEWTRTIYLSIGESQKYYGEWKNGSQRIRVYYHLYKVEKHSCCYVEKKVITVFFHV